MENGKGFELSLEKGGNAAPYLFEVDGNYK